MEEAQAVAHITRALDLVQGGALDMPLVLLARLMAVAPAPFARQFQQAGGLAPSMLARCASGPRHSMHMCLAACHFNSARAPAVPAPSSSPCVLLLTSSGTPHSTGV